ncbi:hypothetical protein E7Z59_05400 [Robertkochia marina]|uniref:Fibronectin type-III domain-containing protein n=1 Tax=Robertkochia marina TaxID=1227945 RepID=A0A4S3M3L8_9FLAO|nr:hypothetical protein [Robertkochia marina]THD69764.1 hypothetical protein E7Z59_05400 [Robertkochia marina]TRZ46892.1 hypothetical protein D3A96_04810 [Robertkochia marina]
MIRSMIPSIFRNTLLAAMGGLLLSCGGESGDTPEPEPVPDPLPAALSLPADNEVCYDGNIISSSMSEVTFSWNPSENTDRYQLEVTNLNTNISTVYPSTGTQIAVSLERGVPYLWWVTSLATGSQNSATSASRRFYLAGEGISNYAPFPAELTGPSSGSTVAANAVTFTWKGSDVDSQELVYALYLDTTDGKTQQEASGITAQTYEVTGLQAGTVYYWSIKTTDPQGNTSRSPGRIFKTQ